MNLDFSIIPRYIPMLLQGAWTTLVLKMCIRDRGCANEQRGHPHGETEGGRQAAGGQRNDGGAGAVPAGKRAAAAMADQRLKAVTGIGPFTREKMAKHLNRNKCEGWIAK